MNRWIVTRSWYLRYRDRELEAEYLVFATGQHKLVGVFSLGVCLAAFVGGVVVEANVSETRQFEGWVFLVIAALSFGIVIVHTTVHQFLSTPHQLVQHEKVRQLNKAKTTEFTATALCITASLVTLADFSVKKTCYIGQLGAPLTPLQRQRYCLNFVYSYPVFVMGFPLFLQMPRPWSVVPVVWLAVIAEFAVGYNIVQIPEPGVDVASLATQVIVAVSFAFFYTVVFRSVELLHRRRFEAGIASKEKTRAVQHQREEIDGYLEALLPPTIINKLLSGKDPVDNSHHATVVTTRIDKFTDWSCTMLPSRSVLVVDRLCSTFDNFILACSALIKVKAVGDVYVAAQGLTDPLPSEDEERCGNSMIGLKFAFWQHYRAHLILRESHGITAFSVKSGIHTGHLVGGLLGLHSLSYEAYGAAYEIALSLSENASGCQVLCTEEALAGTGSHFSRKPGPELVVGEGRSPLPTFLIQRARVKSKVTSKESGNADKHELGSEGGSSSGRPGSIAGSTSSAAARVTEEDLTDKLSLHPQDKEKARQHRYDILRRRLTVVHQDQRQRDHFGSVSSEADTIVLTIPPGHPKTHIAMLLDSDSGIGAEEAVASATLIHDELHTSLERCWGTRFADEELEERYIHHSFEEGVSPAVNSGFALCTSHCLLLLSALYEDAVTYGGVFFLLLGIAVSFAWIVATNKQWRGSGSVLDLIALTASVQFAIIAVVLLHPCTANASIAYLFILGTVVGFNGLTRCPWWNFMVGTFCLCVEVIVIDTARGYMYASYYSILPIGAIVAAVTMKARERSFRSLFASELITRILTASAETELSLQRALLATMVPSSIVDIVIQKAQNRRGALIESLGEVSVCLIRVDSLSTSFPQKGGFEGEGLEVLERLDTVLSAVDGAVRLAQHDQSALVERVYVMGDLILLAGPLLESTYMKSLPAMSTKAPEAIHYRVTTATHNGGVTIHSGGKTIESMGRPTTAVAEDLLIRSAESMINCIGHLLRGLPSTVRLSLILHTSSAFAAVCGMQQPTFSVLGPVTRTVEALMHASVKGVQAVTRSFLSVLDYGQIVLPRFPGDLRITTSGAGPNNCENTPPLWKVRGVGVVTLTPIGIPPPTGTGLHLEDADVETDER